MTYAKQPDKAQARIVEELRQLGYTVAIYAVAGHGVPDLIIHKPLDLMRVHAEWVEVKTWTKKNPPTFEQLYTMLTPAEFAFYHVCPGGPPILSWDALQIHAEYERRRAALQK